MLSPLPWDGAQAVQQNAFVMDFAVDCVKPYVTSCPYDDDARMTVARTITCAVWAGLLT